MRHLPLIALALFVGTSSACGQSATAKEIVDRAIKAQAEKPDDLAKRRIERIVMEGKITFGGDTPIVREIIAEWPTRLRYNNTLKNPQGETRINFALNGDRGWRVGTEIPFEEYDLNKVDEFRAEAHGKWIATLYPLRESSLNMVALPDNRLDNEAVQIVKVTARFRPDVLLFFSKNTGLLVKASYKTSESGAPVRKEHLFGDYKKFEGLLLPSKLADVQNGNRVAEYTVKEYKFLDKQPAGVFDKPSGK